jgi:NADH-quinone oxidoreductase subunit I
MEEPPHPRRLGADEKDYFLGLPSTGQPDNRTPVVRDQAGGAR